MLSTQQSGFLLGTGFRALLTLISLIFHIIEVDR